MVPILLGLQLGGYAVLQYNTIHPWGARRSTRENRIHLLSSTGCLFLGLFFLASTWLFNFFVLFFFFFFFFGGFDWGLHVLSRRPLRLFILLLSLTCSACERLVRAQTPRRLNLCLIDTPGSRG